MAREEMQEIMDQEVDAQKDMYLTFTLSSESYGIQIRYVTEIIGIQPITEVPDLPAYIKGIINLRGKIIPIMDMRLRFKKEYMDYNDRTCVIVAEMNNLSIGLIVDSVSEVESISEDNIVPPPNLNCSSNKYIAGIGKAGNEVKLIINCEKLMTEDEAKSFDNIQ